MLKQVARRAVLPAVMLATLALGGCYVAPYPYGYGYGYYGYGYPAYVGPPVVGAVYVGGYRGRWWR